MRWYIPSWNGDLRLEQEGKRSTRLTIIEPTPHELMTLGRLEHQFRENGWWKGDEPLWTPRDRRRKEGKRQSVLIKAPMDDVAPLLVSTYKPGAQTLTAIVYRDGEIETVDGTEGSQALEKAAKKAVGKKAKKGATVKRATPCCPACEPGSVEPASEVLLEFLDARQHETWARERYIEVRGHRSGHRYLLAHRHSPMAVDLGRICWDADDRTVLHFHDNSVPPEEEVLGAKLVLEHREHWLRNEATVIQPSYDRHGRIDRSHEPELIYENPFGDMLDGVEDAHLTQAVGSFLFGMANGLGLVEDDAWWIQEMGKGLEALAESLGLEPSSEDDVVHALMGDMLSEEAETAFMDAARKLGNTSPTALVHLANYWRRRAIGMSAPDWMGA
jgi:hypothetical protein